MIKKGFFNNREFSLASSDLIVYEYVSLSNVGRKVYNISHEVDNHNASIVIKRVSISE